MQELKTVKTTNSKGLSKERQNVSPSDFHFLSLEGCYQRTPFCGRRRAETQSACVKNYDASANSFNLSTYSVSRKGGKNVLIMRKPLWNNDLSSVNDVSMTYKFHCNCNYSVGEKIGCFTCVSPLVYSSAECFIFYCLILWRLSEHKY